MSIYMTVFKCISMHEYMYVCVCMHLCVYACMYICMHVCIQVCIYVIFKLGFEWYGGNCVSWEGELSGGNCPGEVSGGNCPGGEMSGPRYNSILILVIRSGYFYSASSRTLLLMGALDTARILCRSFTPKRHRQL